MSGFDRNEPGWAAAKLALLDRWVEIAPDAALAWARQSVQKGAQTHDVSRVFSSLAQVDPNRALAEAKSLLSPTSKKNALQSVINVIAQIDPERALDMIDSLKGPYWQSIRYHGFSLWAARDPTGAAARVATLNDRDVKSTALRAVISAWSQRDPDAALSWLKGVSEPDLRQRAESDLFENVGSLDPQRAVALAAALPKDRQTAMIKTIVGGWAQSDPEAAEAWILSRTDKDEQQQMIIAATNSLDFMAPDRAASLLDKLSPGSMRDSAMSRLIQSWARTDHAGAVAFTKTLPEKEQMRLRGALAKALADSNPDAAMAYIKENPLDDPADREWTSLARIIAERSSPEKALAWAHGLNDLVTKEKALDAVLETMARQDPEKAANEAAKLPEGTTREQSVAKISGNWAQNDFDDALTWARGLSGKDRESAVGAALREGAPHQPIAAATQYSTLLEAVPAGQQPANSLIKAAKSIAEAYFMEDGKAALAWATTLPQEDARTAAVAEVAAQWVESDVGGASEWIQTLPKGRPRDEAVDSLVRKIAPSDPEAAFRWAVTVQDEASRESLLKAAVRSWRKSDPAGAVAAINAAPWSDADKALWLEKIK
jgi:hypothetical protein